MYAKLSTHDPYDIHGELLKSFGFFSYVIHRFDAKIIFLHLAMVELRRSMGGRGKKTSPPFLSHEFIIQNHGDIMSCLLMVVVIGLLFQVILLWNIRETIDGYLLEN